MCDCVSKDNETWLYCEVRTYALGSFGAEVL